MSYVKEVTRILGGSSAVSNCISRCVTCRKLRGLLQTEKMADLPSDRIEPSPPFSYCAVDFFGPFLIKERRSEVKRYGVIFVCMACRGVHLETTNSLDTSSFINALRRFLTRRGAIRQLRCDQGTNFVGARNELKVALKELDQDCLRDYLSENGCEWIPFQMNVPHASHKSGSWETLIRTVRNVLETLLQSVGTQLDKEAFNTFMTESECIVNSRPLSTRDLNDSGAPGARFSKVPKLYGPFSGVTIPFVAQERRGFKSSNFTDMFLLVNLKTC